MSIQCNLHILDTIGTQAECPDYRGVLISEVKVKCYVFIQIEALYNLITSFFIKTYERMTKSYKSIEIFINTIHVCLADINFFICTSAIVSIATLMLLPLEAYSENSR